VQYGLAVLIGEEVVTMRLSRRCVAAAILACLGSPMTASRLHAETPIADYARLRESLMRGELPIFVVDFAKCRDGAGAAGPPFAALPGFRSYNLASDFIATSVTHLFEAKDGAMTLEYVRARFYPNDAVDFTLKRLDPASYKSMGAATTYRCSLRDGSVRVRTQGLAEILPLQWDGKALPALGTTESGKHKPKSRD
jgi:hypothetical protein